MFSLSFVRRFGLSVFLAHSNVVSAARKRSDSSNTREVSASTGSACLQAGPHKTKQFIWRGNWNEGMGGGCGSVGASRRSTRAVCEGKEINNVCLGASTNRTCKTKKEKGGHT